MWKKQAADVKLNKKYLIDLIYQLIIARNKVSPFIIDNNMLNANQKRAEALKQ